MLGGARVRLEAYAGKEAGFVGEGKPGMNNKGELKRGQALHTCGVHVLLPPLGTGCAGLRQFRGRWSTPPLRRCTMPPRPRASILGSSFSWGCCLSLSGPH